jgi:NADPH:quinone reductase-like Zn-dependent oxidoreductase
LGTNSPGSRLAATARVLINGAAGGVGTLAVQIAKSFGAHVTGVCSAKNVDLVEFVGADRVIDYSKEDFTRSGEQYDLMFDCVGNHSLAACRRMLIPGGRLWETEAAGESSVSWRAS